MSMSKLSRWPKRQWRDEMRDFIVMSATEKSPLTCKYVFLHIDLFTLIFLHFNLTIVRKWTLNVGEFKLSYVVSFLLLSIICAWNWHYWQWFVSGGLASLVYDFAEVSRRYIKVLVGLMKENSSAIPPFSKGKIAVRHLHTSRIILTSSCYKLLSGL